MVGFSLLIGSFFLDKVPGSVVAAVALVFLALTFKFIPPAGTGREKFEPRSGHPVIRPRFQKKHYDLY